MIKTNQDIISEQLLRNDDGVSAVSEKDKKMFGMVIMINY